MTRWMHKLINAVYIFLYVLLDFSINTKHRSFLVSMGGGLKSLSTGGGSSFLPLIFSFSSCILFHTPCQYDLCLSSQPSDSDSHAGWTCENKDIQFGWAGCHFSLDRKPWAQHSAVPIQEERFTLAHLQHVSPLFHGWLKQGLYLSFFEFTLPLCSPKLLDIFLLFRCHCRTFLQNTHNRKRVPQQNLIPYVKEHVPLN